MSLVVMASFTAFVFLLYGFAILLLAVSIRQDRARARAEFVGAVQLSPELAAAARSRAAAEASRG